jgi:hypothetical protein
MRIFLAVLLACGAVSAPALGDDVKRALKEFGLLGTWARDCSKEISQPRAARIVFSAPLEGGPTATARETKDEVLVTIVYEIAGSAIVDGDKIRVALHPVTVTKSDGAAASQHEYDNVQLVFQKVADRIKVIRIQWEGLPEIEWASVFEKCPG